MKNIWGQCSSAFLIAWSTSLTTMTMSITAFTQCVFIIVVQINVMLIPTTIKYFVRVQGIHELRLAKYELIVVCFTFFLFHLFLPLSQAHCNCARRSTIRRCRAMIESCASPLIKYLDYDKSYLWSSFESQQCRCHSIANCNILSATDCELGSILRTPKRITAN